MMLSGQIGTSVMIEMFGVFLNDKINLELEYFFFPQYYFFLLALF